jgi:transcription termination/antitermination protein NusG
MATHWYVIRVQSGKEEKVRKGLEKRIAAAGAEEIISRVLVPTETVSEIKNGKKRVSKKKIFPGYIMVEMEASDDALYLIRETPGVGDFVGSHMRPTPMEPHEVHRLLGDMERQAEAPKLKINFQKGESVKIKEGPFENFDGIVDEVYPEKGLVRVVVTIFSRPTPVELEYWMVEPI